MSNTPGNEDIDLLVRAYLGDCGPQANRVYSFVTAVLAKWGTPQPVVREPLSDDVLEKAARYDFLRDCNLDDMAAKYWPGGQVPTGEEFDAAIGAALAAQIGKV